MAEKKCLIDSDEGCIIEDETAIVLAVTAVISIGVAFAILLPKILPPPPPPA